MNAATAIFFFLFDLYVLQCALGSIVEDKKKRITIAAITSSVQNAVFFIFNYNYIQIIILFLFFLSVTCFYLRSSPKKVKSILTVAVIYFVSFAVTTVVLSENIQMFLFAKTYFQQTVFTKSFTNTSFLILYNLYKSSKFFSKNAFTKEKTPLYVFIFPLSALSIYDVLWYLTCHANFSVYVDLLIFFVVVIVSISVILTFIFYEKTSFEKQELYRQIAEHKKLENDTIYYSLLEQQNENLREFVHNEKNHLTAIYEMEKDTVVRKYIKDIYSELSEYSSLGRSTNHILELILEKYRYIAKTKGLHFETNTANADLCYFSDPDAVTIFGNILDNAVEAAERSENGFITLNLRKINNFDMLSCINSCDIQPIIMNGELQSSKSDGYAHGYGIKSIKRIVKKYNGEMHWSFNSEEKTFTIEAAFFINEK